MAGRKYGLDLGTNYVKIYDNTRKNILVENNMIAIRKKKDMVAAGDAAYEIYEKVSGNIAIKRPVRGGVIADVEPMGRLFDYLLKKQNCSNSMMRHNEFYLAVPSSITEVEKRAFFSLVGYSSFKTHNASIVEKPVAAALGEGLDVTRAGGIMVVDMGADTTEISIIALGGIVLSRLIKIGGNTINDTICNEVKLEHNVIIGSKTAEFLKLSLGSAIPTMAEPVMAYGRDLITGLPVHIPVPAQLVYHCILTVLEPVVDAIRGLLERTPPELNNDIFDHGIYVTGGTSMIPNMDRLIASRTRMKVNMSSHPQESVVKGLDVIMNSYELSGLAFSVRESAFY